MDLSVSPGFLRLRSSVVLIVRSRTALPDGLVDGAGVGMDELRLVSAYRGR